MLGKALLTAATGMMAGGEALGVEDVFSTFLYTGNGSGQKITNGIALADGVAIAPGTALGGGYFAGFISSTANGVATHALIVAPRATGATGTGYTLTTNLKWKTSLTSTANTTSPFDGAANTAAMIAAGAAAHPAAQFCDNLTIGGFSDWYLPARYELDIAYFNLKPTADSNSTSWGINDYSVPKRTGAYLAGTPAQTSIAAFQSGGGEDFIADAHWSSTEESDVDAWRQTFVNGSQSYSNYSGSKISAFGVRAFRKIAINDPALDPYRVTGEGGLVWIKGRTGSAGYIEHALFDTNRGVSNGYLRTNVSNGAGGTNAVNFAFAANGFSFGSDAYIINDSSIPSTYTSWTFRKAPKFFDIVTYTGSLSNLDVSHNLGSTPGCIIIKQTNGSSNWFVWHRSTTDIFLNLTNAALGVQNEVGNVTASSFRVFYGASNTNLNASATYVAYVFAHDAGGFGDSGNESVVKCGSFTTDSGGSATVDLGWEPQWVLFKRSDGSVAGNWYILDNMRGWTTGTDSELFANSNSHEGTLSNRGGPTSTGFTTANVQASASFIYIAIRRGPMKTPTDATKVFNALKRTGTGSTVTTTAGLTPDLAIINYLPGAGDNHFFCDRLRGQANLASASTGSESTGTLFPKFDQMSGVQLLSAQYNSSGASMIDWYFRRAPGFFDIVAYTGNGSNPRTISHSLGAIPELLIVKSRSAADDWWVYVGSAGITQRLTLNSFNNIASTTTTWGNTAFTNQVFGVGDPRTNASATTYIAYLFATLPGISKVGSYTGTGTTLNIDCGFTSGARFVLIKRTDSAGDWYVWDTARGIIAANDPYLLLNSTAAEVTSTDYIDPLSSGFQISSTAPAAINANGGSFVFLAIS